MPYFPSYLLSDDEEIRGLGQRSRPFPPRSSAKIQPDKHHSSQCPWHRQTQRALFWVSVNLRLRTKWTCVQFPREWRDCAKGKVGMNREEGMGLSSFPKVPVGWPSRGGDVTVYVWHKPTQLAHSFLFCSFCLFLSLWPFQLYFIP